MEAGVIVPAAGLSSRMGGEEKLFADLAGKPVLAWCIDTFEACDVVKRIAIAMNESSRLCGEALARERAWKKCSFCIGGARRQDSVARAYELLDGVDSVIVHDGDRPFVTLAMIEEGLALLEDADVAVACVPVKDTVKVVDDAGMVVETLDRGSLKSAQTPQVMRMSVMRAALRNLDVDVTDDAMLAELMGFRVKVYDGSSENIKITTPEDLVVARVIAERRGPRP